MNKCKSFTYVIFAAFLILSAASCKHQSDERKANESKPIVDGVVILGAEQWCARSELTLADQSKLDFEYALNSPAAEIFTGIVTSIEMGETNYCKVTLRPNEIYRGIKTDTKKVFAQYTENPPKNGNVQSYLNNTDNCFFKKGREYLVIGGYSSSGFVPSKDFIEFNPGCTNTKLLSEAVPELRQIRRHFNIKE